MHRVVTFLTVTALLTAIPAAALAQADAKAAFEAGKAAYEKGQFQQARDHFDTAAKTDVRNPEVFLWLGKAEYQLGQVDEAVAAWTKALALGSKEPYAKKMLETLSGQLVEIDTKIRLVEVVLAEGLYATARDQCRDLLRDKALTGAQRAKVLTLGATTLVEMGKASEALAVLQEIAVAHAADADPAKMALLTGLAKLRTGALAEGLELLKKVMADHSGTTQAARAEYELIAWRIDQAPTAAAAGDLAKWLAAKADLVRPARARMARRKLMEAYLALAGRLPAPVDAKLSDLSRQAIAVASDIIGRTVTASDARSVAQPIFQHLDGHYGRAGAYAAAIEGVELLMKAPLPRPERLRALQASADFRVKLAFHELTAAAKAGRLTDPDMPKLLADAVADYEAINRDFLDRPAWKDLAGLAEMVARVARQAPWPQRITAPKPAQSWAVQIALMVIKADADSAAVKSAVDTVGKIVDECAKLTGPESRPVALEVQSKMLAALSPKHSVWSPAMWKQVGLLDANAVAVLADNVKAGRDDDNAKMNAYQERMLAAMTAFVGREAGTAKNVLAKLSAHLKPWIARGHYELARSMHEQLAPALPARQQRQCRLAIAALWVEQVRGGHARLVAAGLKVPPKLDAGMVQALHVAYSLQAELEASDPLLRQARGIWDGVISHYRGLEYFDVAAEAVKVRPDGPPVAAAEAYASLLDAILLEEAAWRELNELLTHYKADEKIALTDAYKTAIAAHKKFITDYPDSPLIASAAGRLAAVAGHFGQLKAHDVAADVYRDLADFAAKVKLLAQAPPGQASAAQSWQYAAAMALHAQASEALAKAIAQQKPNPAPPEKINAEFAAAVDAYQTFIRANPDSPLTGPAVGRIMAAALEYAKADAWDVAEGIYANLLAAELTLARPERIEFCRGLCQLGKVMPDHARKVLAELARADVGDKRPALPAATMVGGYAGEAAGSPMIRALPGPMAAGKGGGGGGGGTLASAGAPPGRPKKPEPADELALADSRTLTAIRGYERQRAVRVAQMRDRLQFKGKAQAGRRPVAVAPVLSEAEIARQDKALAAAYDVFKAIRAEYPDTPTAKQARGEIMIMIQHWRTIAQWVRAAKLARQYLTDSPTDPQLPQLRLGVAADLLAWAAQPGKDQATRQERLAEVAERFAQARAELAAIATDFADDKAVVGQARWQIANSFLTQARAVDAFSATLARGQYVRAASELQQLAQAHPDHPKVTAIPQMLWDIAGELAGRQYFDEAITVWNGLLVGYPTHSLAGKAAESIARTYLSNLKRPLLAAETYMEINFARGGQDLGVQNQIFQIGENLRGQKRWVEALHVLEVFVDSFPRHPSAGQALTMIGHIHQANEAWADAIAAYRRVMNEFADGTWVRDAKWSIAECTINLSQWSEAIAAYRSYLTDYAKDARAAEATRRIGICKDLARYQGLVDEAGQRKAFDAQYQIAQIVLNKLSNPVKAIIEYRKVEANWPESHLADDALFRVGTSYLAMGETDKAREALLAVATKYATSPLADDALFLIGKSYEDEAVALAGVTREQTVQLAQKKAQKEAYKQVQADRGRLRADNRALIKQLREGGKDDAAELQTARFAAQEQYSQAANVTLAARRAGQRAEALSAAQLADRQDKINAALRKAVQSYVKASTVAGADKADEALLRMADIYAEKLKDVEAAMKTYLEIVRQFSGTAVAEDASWRIAQHYERQGEHGEAITAYEAFLRNYRRSPKAGQAQFAIAENYENLGQWVKAMDAYTNYITNFPKGPLVEKAREQINWIKTYRL